MRNPLEFLKTSLAKPLGVHTVATPEILRANERDEMPETERAELSGQFIAELSGDEMDSFASVWSTIREKYIDEDDPSLGREYKRAAVAFCWCDDKRNRFYADASKVWEVVCMLRGLPDTLTSRMFIVANGANAFVGIDDETKKNSSVTTTNPKNDAGNGEQP